MTGPRVSVLVLCLSAMTVGGRCSRDPGRRALGVGAANGLSPATVSMSWPSATDRGMARTVMFSSSLPRGLGMRWWPVRSAVSGNLEQPPSVSCSMAAVPGGSPQAVVPWSDDLVQLYEQHYDSLVRLAYLVSGRATVAEEVVQDAFVKAHRSWDRVRDPLAYVRTAVINGCRSWGRPIRPGQRSRSRAVSASI
jgi:Sigma-70 region 2